MTITKNQGWSTPSIFRSGMIFQQIGKNLRIFYLMNHCLKICINLLLKNFRTNNTLAKSRHKSGCAYFLANLLMTDDVSFSVLFQSRDCKMKHCMQLKWNTIENDSNYKFSLKTIWFHCFRYHSGITQCYIRHNLQTTPNFPIRSKSPAFYIFTTDINVIPF